MKNSLKPKEILEAFRKANLNKKRTTLKITSTIYFTVYK